MQKQYGKTAEELETLVDGFAWALDGYEMPDIMAAFGIYIRKKSDIPAPADIIKIMEKEKERRMVEEPSIEKLRSYQAKGIPLIASQIKQLEEADGYQTHAD